jgi:hypothetical protein
MSQLIFYKKTGDTLPLMAARIGAKPSDYFMAVRFVMARKNGEVVIDGSGIVEAQPDPETGFGLVFYRWTADDAELPAGTYFGEFEITHNNGSIETFPNVGHIEIRITEELG